MGVVYNLLLLGDYTLAFDEIETAILIHFLIVTPFMFCVYFLINKCKSHEIREIVASSLSIVIVAQVLYIYIQSMDRNVHQYIYLVLPPILYSCIIQRLFFRYAVATTLLSLLMTLSASLWVDHAERAVALMAVVTIAACAYTALSANFYLELDTRLAYLNSLRDRLRIEEADGEAKHDALTGLANRHVLNRRTAEIWGDAKTSRFPVSLILIDIDHFKSYNDVYGHSAGDTCLKRVAARLIAELRGAEDLAVRYGGEEFLLLLPRTPIETALVIAERIRASVEALAIPHTGTASVGFVTVSVGVAAADASISIENLINAADSALYEAKRQGRNLVRSA